MFSESVRENVIQNTLHPERGMFEYFSIIPGYSHYEDILISRYLTVFQVVVLAALFASFIRERHDEGEPEVEEERSKRKPKRRGKKLYLEEVYRDGGGGKG